MIYPWYEQLSSGDRELLQGDLIPFCPVLIPPKAISPGGEYDLDVVEYDVTIVSQSCDLEQGKVDNVLVCPYYPFREYIRNGLRAEEQASKKAVSKYFDDLRKGNQPNYHLLNQAAELGINDYLVVDFRNVFAVHIDFLKAHVETLNNRVRLLPPYREHLSQAFARFFMRVGLPQNIPPIDSATYL